jgi:hypothetical protein
MLRSCYSTGARFFKDRPDIVSDITWYFCPPGAKILDGPHRFGSLNWLREKGTDSPIGEVPGLKRKWVNGQTPAGATGQKSCGQFDDYYFGVDYDKNADYPIENGLKACCAVPRIRFALGLALRSTWVIF